MGVLEGPRQPKDPSKPPFIHYSYDPAGVVQSPKNPESRKDAKKIQNPRPQVAPRKYEKITEKIQRRQFFGPFFGIFSVIFSYFRGGDLGSGILYFFLVSSSYFQDSGFFFWGSVPPPRHRNITVFIFPGILFGIPLHSLYRKYFSAEINFALHYIILSWDIVGLLQGSKRPLPRKLRKKSEKGLPGLSAPGSKKREKKSKKSRKRVKNPKKT